MTAVGRPGRIARRRPARTLLAGVLGAVIAAVATVATVTTVLRGQPDRSSVTLGGSSSVDCDTEVDRALRAWAEAGFSGSVAVRGGDRECVAGYGLADRESGRENTPETVFSIGSVTKAVTAAGVVELVDRGALSLDDPAGRYVSGLTGPIAEVTLRDLLLHSSGLVGTHGFDHEPLTAAETVELVSAMDTGFDPGTQYLYSNTNYTVLALVIDSVTDGYRDFLSSTILVDGEGEPVGGFWDGEPAASGPRAVGYLTGRGPGEPGDFPGPHWALDGNGGVAMTPSELAEWTRALFSGQILSGRAVDLLTSTTSRLGDGGVVELPGWGLLDDSLAGVPVITASGGGGAVGHAVDVTWLPETGEVIVVAQNADSWRTGSIGEDVAVALAVGTAVPGPPEVTEADPATVSAAVGTFRLPDGGQLEIAPDGPGLAVTAEGAGALAALLPTTTDLAADAERHERQSLAFLEGSTEEGRRHRERIEAEHGAIVGVDVLGTLAGGGLTSLVEVQFEDSALLYALTLDRYGGSEAVGPVGRPRLPFVADATGSFTRYGADPDGPAVVLRPVDGGIAISGPGGTVLAERVG